MDPSSTTTARYEIVRRLASGGMAEVFLAREQRPGGFERLVVVKRVFDHFKHDRGFREMFDSESRLAMQLQHPNIVQILDAGTDAGVPFIAMEWLDGTDVRTILVNTRRAGERIEPALAAAIVAGAARGLHYMHMRRDARGQPLNVVHRDISPHNLFVTRDGGVKVLDFGIAKSALQSEATQSGVVKGKLGYMAPEQVTGRELDARTDLFALGIVLWELLAQRRLFTGDSDMETAQAIVFGPVPAPSSLVAEVPSELDAITLQLLSKLKAGRPSTAEDVARRLDAIVHALGCVSAPDALARLVARVSPPGDPVALTTVDDAVHRERERVRPLPRAPSAADAHRADTSTTSIGDHDPRGAAPTASMERDDAQSHSNAGSVVTASIDTTPDTAPPMLSPIEHGSSEPEVRERTASFVPPSAPDASPQPIAPVRHAPDATTASTPRASRTPVIVATGALLAIGLGILVVRRTPRSETAHTAVHLHVGNAPVDARITLDGIAIAADSEIAPSARPRRLEVRRGEQTLFSTQRAFDRDVDIALPEHTTAPVLVAPVPQVIAVATRATTPQVSSDAGAASPARRHIHRPALLGTHGIDEYPRGQ